MKSYSKLIMLFFLLIIGAGTASAASPVGQWSVTFYLEPGLTTGATQGICFLSNNTWYSSTVHGWVGDWFQKGDRFRWYGHTSAPLPTAEFGQFVANTIITGEFAHFFTGTPPVTSSRGNWRATKVSTICAPPAALPSVVSGGGDPAK
jgi:hypothetical protein